MYLENIQNYNLYIAIITKIFSFNVAFMKANYFIDVSNGLICMRVASVVPYK